MTVRDEILAILRGGLAAPPDKHLQLSRMLLGVALGSLAVDAGLSDRVILQSCELLLKQIRSGAADADVVKQLQDAQVAAAEAVDRKR